VIVSGEGTGDAKHVEATLAEERPTVGRSGRKISGWRSFDPTPLPVWITVIAVVGICALALPLVGMGNRVPWTRIPQIVASSEARDALWLSMRTCVAATVIDLILGVPIALLLARDWPGVAAVRVLVLLPLSLPPVVAGLALLATFGRRGMIGSSLHAAGITIAFSTAAVVMAQVFVSLPFLVTTLESSVRTRSWGLEQTAAALGAGSWRILTTITLPTVAPALGRGAALAAARCLGEFGATITFAGSLQGVTQTMPLEVYLARETDSDTAMALGLVLVLVGAVVVGLTQRAPGGRSTPPRGPVSSTAVGGAVGQRIQRSSAQERPPVRAHDHSFQMSSDPSNSTTTGSTSTGLASVHVDGQMLARDWYVRLDIDPGQVVAVMGPNGAGKSTLAGVVTGLLALDGGQVRIGERIVDAGNGRVLRPGRRGVALLTQDARVFGHMSVLDNVAYGPRSHGQGRMRSRAIALRQLEALGCAHLAARRGGQLSGGQTALVGLARALAVDPAVLVLDEPTAALDIDTQMLVRRQLRSRLEQTSTTTLLITHDVADTTSVADRLVVLERGRVVEDGTVQQLLNDPRTPFTAQLAGLMRFTGQVPG